MLMKFEQLVGELSDWITNDDPLAVNTTLKVLVENFTVDSDKIIHIAFKE